MPNQSVDDVRPATVVTHLLNVGYGRYRLDILRADIPPREVAVDGDSPPRIGIADGSACRNIYQAVGLGVRFHPVLCNILQVLVAGKYEVNAVLHHAFGHFPIVFHHVGCLQFSLAVENT